METIHSINKELQATEKAPIIISGPCSAESEDQLIQTAIDLKKGGQVDVFRAGIWKPRTKPGSFEGVGSIGLGWLNQVKKETGFKTAIEVANVKHVYEALKNNVDILWIGARTSVNPFSVQEIAEALKGVDATVLIKNPINPDVALWEGAIERFLKCGVTKVGAIHRGFSSFAESNYRNPPLWRIPIELKRRLPEVTMICDPSHICGNTTNLLNISQKALDLNFDGLMLESHNKPAKAWSDAKQQVTPEQLTALVKELIVRDKIELKTLDQLGTLREKINIIDEELIDLMAKRMEISDEIGAYKKENNITILQAGRWNQLLHDTINNGTGKGLNKDFIQKLLDIIHVESIDRQNKIMND